VRIAQSLAAVHALDLVLLRIANRRGLSGRSARLTEIRRIKSSMTHTLQPNRHQVRPGAVVLGVSREQAQEARRIGLPDRNRNGARSVNSRRESERSRRAASTSAAQQRGPAHSSRQACDMPAEIRSLIPACLP